MASVPADATSTELSTTGADTGSESRSDLLFGFNRLNLLRQIGLMVGLAASVALGVAVVLWAQEPDYQPVLGDLSSYNPMDVSRILDQSGIQYKMDGRSGALLVASDDVYNARLKLAAEGVTDRESIGFELLDQDRGLGTSQFTETVSFRRGLEGELARTISSMRSVKSARVHLAIPERSVFVRDARQPSASVFLNLFAGRRIEQEQISAIVNLVAGSVPEMNRDQVTVVDQNGNLLTGREEDASRQEMRDQYQYTTRVEERLTRRVASMIAPIVGDSRFRAEVSAELDFSSVEQAEELFNPQQQAVRSEREFSEQRTAGSQGGIPGALSNQPPGAATVPEQAAATEDGEAAQPVDIRRESTRNYEVDRTVSYIRQAQGDVKRVTVALVLDDKPVVNAETGAVTFEPWDEQELQRISMLVRDAVGYSASRGDSVTVVNAPFAPDRPVEYMEPSFWEQPWFWSLMKQVLAAAVILALVLGLLRPVLKTLSGGGRRERDSEYDSGEGAFDDLDISSDKALADAMSGSSDLLLPGASDSYDRHLNALKGLIAEDPARVAQVMRQWVNVDD